MKLRNKKTGEIVEVKSLDVDTPTEGIIGIPSFDRKGSYNSLAELNEEWEDAPEEPKEYWNIEWDGAVCHTTSTTEEETRLAKQIGNYFETKEEAEKAVERLCAWKRLKDKGFRFDWWKIDQKKHLGVITIKTEPYCSFEFEDLDLLFGGEE